MEGKRCSVNKYERKRKRPKRSRDRKKKSKLKQKQLQRDQLSSSQFTNRSMPTMSATKHEQPSTPPQETPIPKARHLNKHHHHPLSPPSAQRPTAPTSLPPNLSTTPHPPQASPAHAPFATNPSLSSSTKASQTSTPNPAHSPTNGNNASAGITANRQRGKPGMHAATPPGSPGKIFREGCQNRDISGM